MTTSVDAHLAFALTLTLQTWEAWAPPPAGSVSSLADRPAESAAAGLDCWERGDGERANLAVDRAFAAEPGYSMAALLEEALSASLVPRTRSRR